jgi:hypothetical protein
MLFQRGFVRRDIHHDAEIGFYKKQVYSLELGFIPAPPENHGMRSATSNGIIAFCDQFYIRIDEEILLGFCKRAVAPGLPPHLRHNCDLYDYRVIFAPPTFHPKRNTSERRRHVTTFRMSGAE